MASLSIYQQTIKQWSRLCLLGNQWDISLIPLSRSIACTQIDTVSGDICCAIISPLVPFVTIVNLEHFDILAIILV
jgi:hypothetical protein